MPILSLTTGNQGAAVAEWDVPSEGAFTPQASQVTVQETERYGFRLHPVAPGTEYRLYIGDQNVGEEGQPESAGPSQMIRMDNALFWVDYMYFESARGWTTIHLEDRRASGAPWVRIGSFQVYALPTKLGEERYQAMVDDLRALWGGLLIDVLGKSSRNIDLLTLNKGISFRSKEMELREVAAVWRRLGRILDLLSRSPGTAPAPTMEWASYWGDKTLSPYELRQLAARGINPKRLNMARPVTLRRIRYRDSFDIPEHRLLAGFGQMLQQRLIRCIEAIDDHQRAIEADRPYRHRSYGDQPSLYDQMDLPRLQQLGEARKLAVNIYADIYQALHKPPLADIPRVLKLPPRECFGQNDLYRQARAIMEKFMRSSSFWAGDGPGDAMTKLSSRMYEQWVFISLVNCFREMGLGFSGWDELLGRDGGQKFMIDFDRGMGFTAHLTGRKYMRIRYEPWILPLWEARAKKETLFRGGKGQAPWCPDVLMECLLEKSGRFQTIYGVAVDCKYTPRITAHHWERTRKYRYIRSCSTNRQVIRQVWLANPDQGNRITIFDPYIWFSKNGFTCSAQDTFEGILPAIPGQNKDEIDPIQRYAQGILQFFNRLDIAS